MDEPLSFRDYGAKAIRESLVRMLSHVEGVRQGEDIEAVHDMRVASRRLRAAISVFAPAFSGARFEEFEREVKAITDALSVARDLDVMIDTLEKLDLSLPEKERAGIEAFIERKRRERQAQQKVVLSALKRMERKQLLRVFDEITGKMADAAACGGSGDSPSDTESAAREDEPPAQIGGKR